MAEKLESFNFPAPGRTSTYPWDEWLDGSIWQLTPGTDFQVTAESLRVQAHKAARLRNLSLRTSSNNGVLVIQATPRR